MKMSGTVTAFLEEREVASGEREDVTRLLEDRYPADHSAIIVFEDATGRVTDLDYWDALKSAPARKPGRPRLGVQSREVTLLPRHWEWLAIQPGGASAALRRLVDEARREGGGGDRARKDAVYNFMQAACGDRAGYEDALRALYRDDQEAFAGHIAAWPQDIRRYITRLSSIA
jgi:hypothetical protein